MKRIVCAVLLALVCMGSDGAMGGALFTRAKCQLSFVEPDGVDYIDMTEAEAPREGCILGFAYTGALKVSELDKIATSMDDRRIGTDIFIEFEETPLSERIKKIEADGYDPKLYHLASKKHYTVEGGEVYIFKYAARNPKELMRRYGDSWDELIFIAGNESYSAIYYSSPYKGWPKWKQDKQTKIIEDLFSSLKFTQQIAK